MYNSLIKNMITQRQYLNNVFYYVRQIHSCATVCSMKKQAKVMAKIMTGSKPKRKNWHIAEGHARMPILPNTTSFQTGALTKKRTDVLNKLFMRSITDILATGEVTTDLIGRGISITNVKVSYDFKVVNVYWTAKGNTHDTNLEKVLEKAGFDLRHALCQLHIIGVVPKISFVRDRHYAALETIEYHLEELKLRGDLDVEEPKSENLKAECDLETSLVSDVEGAIKDEEFAVALPEMTHDVFGLNHASILNKIKSAVVKSQARHRMNPADETDVTYIEDQSSFGMNSDSGISEVAHFIKKQKQKQIKIMRAEKKEFLNSLVSKKEYKEEEYVDIADGDFIEEIDDSWCRK